MSEDCFQEYVLINFINGLISYSVDLYRIKTHLEACHTCREKAELLAKQIGLPVPNLSVA